MRFRAQCEDTCHGHPASMTDAQLPSGCSQRFGRSRCATREPNLRRRSWLALDHYIGKCNPRTKTGADRLEHGLLRGKSTRQALDTMDPIADFIQFGLHEATRNERITRVLYPPPNLGDVHHVNAVSENVHKYDSSLRRHKNESHRRGSLRHNDSEQGGTKR